jgi:hypothetical protein
MSRIEKYVADVADRLFEIYLESADDSFASKYPMLDYYGLSAENFEILE